MRFVRSRHLFKRIAMHREKRAAIFHLSFVALGFVFGEAHSNRRPDQAACCPPTPKPAKPAIIGPAAIKGPTPGMASAPIPASTSRAPPMTPPAVTLPSFPQALAKARKIAGR
jgi:hypothetical protein